MVDKVEFIAGVGLLVGVTRSNNTANTTTHRVFVVVVCIDDRQHYDKCARRIVHFMSQMRHTRDAHPKHKQAYEPYGNYDFRNQ